MKYLRLFESVVPKVDEEQVTKYCLRFTLSSPLMMNKGSHKDDMSYEQFYNKILSYDVDIIGDLDPRTIIEYNQHMKELTSILNSEDELRAEFLSLDKKLGKCFKYLPDPLDIEDIFIDLLEFRYVNSFDISYNYNDEDNGYINGVSCRINIEANKDIEEELNKKCIRIKSLLGFDFGLLVDDSEDTITRVYEYTLTWYKNKKAA